MKWSDYFPWVSDDITESHDNLISLRNTLKNFENDNDKVEEAICSFLVLRSCGHVELCLERGLLDSFRDKTPPELFRHTEAGFFHGNNPWPDHIQKVLGSFSESWKNEISAYFSNKDELLRREMKFLVQQRNAIAHISNGSVGRGKTIYLCNCTLLVSDKILEIITPVNVPSNLTKLSEMMELIYS